jgi:rRNA maturation endonuclease Nob1
MSTDDKIFNPRTNRYVTRGSTAFRRMVNQDRKEKHEKESKKPKIEDEKKKDDILKEKSKYKSKPKEEVYSSYKEIKERKPDDKAREELTSMAMKVIKNNDDKFRKVRGDQNETDKLLKKLLYEKLAKPKKSHRSPVKKSRPKSFLDDLASLSYSDSSQHSD